MSEPKQKVRIDFFIADVANVEIDVSEELLEGMMEKATQYLQIKGGVGWQEFSLMSDLTRFVFQQAAERLHERKYAANDSKS